MRQQFRPTEKPTIEAVKEQFDNWRNTRKVQEPIPAELWNAAASLCGRGPQRPYLIAQKLGLNYSKLKQHLPASNTAPPIKKAPAQSAFVELDLGTARVPPECMVEMQDEKGRQLKFHLKGQSCPDLIEIFRAFFRKDP
jgi:hypothetical protein